VKKMPEIGYLTMFLVFVGSVAFTLFSFGGWRVWRKYLAPPEQMCGRDYIKKVNYFYLTIVLSLLVGNILQLIQQHQSEWNTIKGALGFG